MGGEDSKMKEVVADAMKNYAYLQKNAITEEQFVNGVFRRLDLDQTNGTSGPMFISGTHVLKKYYSYLRGLNRGVLSRRKAMDAIEQLYDQPKKAVECSYKLVQAEDSHASIVQKQLFVDYIMNCFEAGVESILKSHRCEDEFKNCFREWTNKSRPTLLAHTQKMFDDNSQGNSDFWTQGDFKRWILSRNHWTIFVQIKGISYNIPLNVLCLFGISIEQKK